MHDFISTSLADVDAYNTLNNTLCTGPEHASLPTICITCLAWRFVSLVEVFDPDVWFCVMMFAYRFAWRFDKSVLLDVWSRMMFTQPFAWRFTRRNLLVYFILSVSAYLGMIKMQLHMMAKNIGIIIIYNGISMYNLKPKCMYNQIVILHAYYNYSTINI